MKRILLLILLLALPRSVYGEEFTGTLELVVVDRHTYTRDIQASLTPLGGSRITLLLPPGTEVGLQTGDAVRVTGALVAPFAPGTDVKPTLVVTTIEKMLGARLRSLLPAAPLMAETALVMLIRFQDYPQACSPDLADPCTQAEFQAFVDQKLAPFFAASSRGDVTFTGTVTPWFVIPRDSTEPCDGWILADLARAAARAAGYEPNDYRRQIAVYMPPNTCGWWGLGTLGGLPSFAWITWRFRQQVFVHELGHNLGLHHAHAWAPDGTRLEYGDVLDVMGGSAGDYGAFAKRRLGWPLVSQVATAGMVHIWPYTPDGFVLRLPEGYVTKRQRQGSDTDLSTTIPVEQGLALHTGDEANPDSSFLIDASTENDRWNPILLPGRTAPVGGTVVTGLDPMTVQIGATPTATPTPRPTVTPMFLLSYELRQTAVRAMVQTTSFTRVTFTLNRPDGIVVIRSDGSGWSGKAAATLAMGRPPAAGRYLLRADASTGHAETSFTLP